MTDLVVLVPTLGRPQKLAEVAEAFRATAPPHRLLFIVEESDRDSVETAGAVARASAGTNQVAECLIVEQTGFARKINAGIMVTREPFIQFAADDVKPWSFWFERAVQHMNETIGVVSLNDLGNGAVMRGRLATFPLVARWYVEKYGQLLHEGYKHNCVDVEMTELAKKRGAFAYEPSAIMEHMHPLWHKGEMDKTYEDWAYEPEGIAADNALLEERRKLWT